MILLASAQSLAAAGQSLLDRIEMLDWTDPERAAQLIEVAADPAPAAETLAVRGMVYVDAHRDAELGETLERLARLARAGDPPASLALGFVNAYSLYQRDRYDDASAILKHLDFSALRSDSERYRFSILRGNTLRMLGQAEAALPYLERALDLAHEMQDEQRSLHALLWLARIYSNTGNFDQATAKLQAARQLATALGDEAALVEVEGCMSNIADQHGDRAGERRASLLALDHAKRAGSTKWLAHALINLGDSYLKTGDYVESLKYSKLALPMVQKLRQGGDEPIVLFNEGLAHIGLGNIKPGEKLAESAIAKVIEGNNLLDAKQMLRDYAEALEHAGYLMMAIQVFHRYDAASEQSMNSTRQRAFLELGAKFDDERRARELELLRRDYALKASEMQRQQLHQQLVIAAAIFVTCICAALTWAFARIKRANDRLRFNSERDALTGLRNRRYFNEHVLTLEGSRPVVGCVLLADIDHFKRINDTLGHPAGDAVLATVSHRLSAALRDSDALVRWGGEEFLAVLDPITPEQADQTVERLLNAVRSHPVLWNGDAISCTISIGYAWFPLSGSSAEISLERAISFVDKALYEAKRRGRDRACLIGAVKAVDEHELVVISGDFESAAASSRIALVDMGAAA